MSPRQCISFPRQGLVNASFYEADQSAKKELEVSTPIGFLTESLYERQFASSRVVLVKAFIMKLP